MRPERLAGLSGRQGKDSWEVQMVVAWTGRRAAGAAKGPDGGVLGGWCSIGDEGEGQEVPVTRMVYPGGGLLAGAQTQPLQGLGFPTAWRPGVGWGRSPMEAQTPSTGVSVNEANPPPGSFTSTTF